MIAAMSMNSIAADLRLFAKYHLKRRVFDYPARETELGLVELDFDSDAFEAELRDLAPRFQVETLGRVDYGGRPHAIHCVSPASTESRKTLLILGGVHGNERAGILAIPEIFRSFDQPGIRLVAVAPVNPVGAFELSRYNGDGFDINRDFARFDTREACVVREVLERERPDFVVSLHEGPQDDSFMFLNRFVDLALATRLAKAIEEGGASLARRDYFGRVLDPPGVAPMGIGIFLLTKLWAGALQMKSTGMWCDDRAIPEVTLESSWRNQDRDARVRAHVDLVTAVARELGAT